MRTSVCRVFAVIACTCLAGPAFAQQVGVAAAVNPRAVSQSPEKPMEQLVIGKHVVRNEKISTFNKGRVQLLFADQSTLTLAENSEIVIDKYVYDSDKQAGEMTATVTTGVLRYVGGKISKKKGVQFLTPSGAVTVRGGIALIKVTPDSTASTQR